MQGDLGELIPLESVARTIEVLGHLETIDGLVQTADKIHTNFPKPVRDSLVCGDCQEQGLDLHSAAKVSIALAQLDPKVRDELSRMIEEVRRFISEDEEASEIDSDTLAVIAEMMVFIQGLGSRSVRTLLQGLKAANEGDYLYLLLEMQGSKREVVSARRVSETTKTDFGLN